MYNQQIIDDINKTCGEDPRDFSESEKQFLISCGFSSSDNIDDYTVADNLLYWFHCRASDGYWTDANTDFMQELTEKKANS